MLHGLVGRLGAPDVHFPGHVSNEELVAYYDVADLFLCASEHEGFCVPLIEAFHMRVPVVALRRHRGARDDGRRRRALRGPRSRHTSRRSSTPCWPMPGCTSSIIASQDAALARLAASDFGGTLLRFVEQALAAPRHGGGRGRRSTSGTSLRATSG